jgi:tellurite resistance protein TerC
MGCVQPVRLAMLALDLGVFHRHSHEVKLKEALTWSAVWISMALVFNVLVYRFLGADLGLKWTTGYLIEKALSVDNVFVFLLIFGYFRVPKEYQHKVLFWGIIGALVMRAICIAAGVSLLKQFHWIIYFFGALLVFSGIKMLFMKDKKIEPEKNPVIRGFRKLMPVTSDYVGDKFFTKIDGKKWATPLFLGSAVHRNHGLDLRGGLHSRDSGHHR